jgi:hypothetical protein
MDAHCAACGEQIGVDLMPCCDRYMHPDCHDCTDEEDRFDDYEPEPDDVR